METITIALADYIELVKKAERIETVKRMYERVQYVAEEDIKVALDIRTEKGDTENGPIR